MKPYDKVKVIENYYKASNALMEIGTTENIPNELALLSVNASRAVIKIIEFMNTHRLEGVENETK